MNPHEFVRHHDGASILKVRGHRKSVVSRVRLQKQTVQPITPDRVRIASRMAHQ